MPGWVIMRCMSKSTTYTHPQPTLDRITQYGAAALCLVMLLSVPGQLFLTQLGAPLFVVTALITLLLVPPVLMVTAATPPITIETDGVWIEPLIWGRRFIPWDAVITVKDYPLLPTPNAEANRRAFVGRRNYQPAEGIMLVVPGLPPQYRVAAFFAGEGGRGIIALTNRTHTDYPKLKKQIVRYAGEVISDD